MEKKSKRGITVDLPNYIYEPLMAFCDHNSISASRLIKQLLKHMLKVEKPSIWGKNG